MKANGGISDYSGGVSCGANWDDNTFTMTAGTLITTGSERGGGAVKCDISVGLEASSVVVNGGTITATGKSVSRQYSQSFGIKGHELTMNAGEITASAATAGVDGSSGGLNMSNKFTMNGGTIYAKTTSIGTNYYAMGVDGTVPGASTIIIKSKNGGNYTDDAAFYNDDGWHSIKLGADASGAVATDVKITKAATDYTLTVTAGTGGTASGSKTLAQGATTTITASANPNYTFSSWSVSGAGSSVASASSASTTFTMGSANATVTANFTYNGSSAPAPNTDTTQAPTQPPATVPVIVDGKEINIGNVTVKGDTATITVNQMELDKQIATAHDSVVIPVTTNSNTVSAQLVVKNIEDISEKHMSLTVQIDNISYELPATAVDTQALMKQFGTDDPAKVPVSINITTHVDDTTQAQVDKSVKKLGSELVVPAVQFTITANYEGKEVEVDTFNSYVGRTITVTPAQAKKITTAVVVEPNGTTRHVPTKVYEENGIWYAKINSRTNSTYVLIYKKDSFTDTKGKSYAAMAKEMTSRKIMTGFIEKGVKTFQGEKKITNTNFVLTLVRALGLPEDSDYSVFKKVTAQTANAGALGTAYEYGLITKAEAAKFVPGKKISRQDAMLMVARAAKVADYKGKSVSITSYADASLVKKENLSAVKFCVGSGLDNGSKGKLRPTDYITRAEVGSMVLKLLQKSKLV